MKWQQTMADLCLARTTTGLVKGEDVRQFTIWDLFEAVPESQVRQPLILPWLQVAVLLSWIDWF